MDKAKLQRRRKELDNRKRGGELQEVPKPQWPRGWDNLSEKPQRVWRSSRFLVVLYNSPHEGIVRLTVNRVDRTDGDWNEGITWDELQDIKRLCGFGNLDATEIYPADRDVVHVANMRHLWIHLNEPVLYKWSRED